MRYDPIPKSLYIKNRNKLKSQLKSASLVVINSNDIMPTNGDGAMPFRQNSDMLYLTGIDQEESILIFFPDAFREEHREILFLKETSDEIAIWEGHKFTKEEAREQSGIQEVHWLNEFDKIFKTIVPEAENIYLNSNEHLRASNPVQTRDDRFRAWCKDKYPIHNYERVTPILHRLRSVKEPEEIEAIRHACKITRDTFAEILEFVKPGVMEYEIQAVLLNGFMMRKSRGPAYEPIIASGFNACVLHYIDNSKICKDGDVILLDIGAEYANYAADMSRSIPVNGRFTDRQKAVYNSVLHVMKECKKILKPGIQMDDYHLQVGKLMEKELVDLGLITLDDIKNEDSSWPAYKKYFMHGTSHYLGLDVHDVGMWTEPIKENMVFTIEPGIYIREEGLGIRLENNIVVSADNDIDFMSDIPLEADEIESIMNQ